MTHARHFFHLLRWRHLIGRFPYLMSSKKKEWGRIGIIVLSTSIHTVPKIRFMYSQKWNCAASFPIPQALIRLFPNSYIHVSVCDLFIPRINLPFWLQQNRQTNPGNIQIAHRYINVESGRNNEAGQFHFQNTNIGTRHLYCILTGPSFAVNSSRTALSIWLVFIASSTELILKSYYIGLPALGGLPTEGTQPGEPCSTSSSFCTEKNCQK
jgi:hypothetical protein